MSHNWHGKIFLQPFLCLDFLYIIEHCSHRVGGCLDWTQDCCDFGIGSQISDLIHRLYGSHPGNKRKLGLIRILLIDRNQILNLSIISIPKTICPDVFSNIFFTKRGKKWPFLADVFQRVSESTVCIRIWLGIETDIGLIGTCYAMFIYLIFDHIYYTLYNHILKSSVQHWRKFAHCEHSLDATFFRPVLVRSWVVLLKIFVVMQPAGSYF